MLDPKPKWFHFPQVIDWASPTESHLAKLVLLSVPYVLIHSVAAFASALRKMGHHVLPIRQILPLQLF